MQMRASLALTPQGRTKEWRKLSVARERTRLTSLAEEHGTDRGREAPSGAEKK